MVTVLSPVQEGPPAGSIEAVGAVLSIFSVSVLAPSTLSATSVAKYDTTVVPSAVTVLLAVEPEVVVPSTAIDLMPDVPESVAVKDSDTSVWFQPEPFGSG